jgi:hypothetical protein
VQELTSLERIQKSHIQPGFSNSDKTSTPHDRFAHIMAKRLAGFGAFSRTGKITSLSELQSVCNVSLLEFQPMAQSTKSMEIGKFVK